jgi:hypothetical protein
LKKIKLAYYDIHLCCSKEEKDRVGGTAKETKLYTLFTNFGLTKYTNRCFKNKSILIETRQCYYGVMQITKAYIDL